METKLLTSCSKEVKRINKRGRVRGHNVPLKSMHPVTHFFELSPGS
jgi:hypothetical protein